MTPEELLRRVQKRLEDMSAPLTEIGQDALIQIDGAFLQERSLDGQPWEPNRPTTRKRGGKILQDTGKYFQSFRFFVSKDGLTIESDSPLFPFHQEGTEDMPARPIGSPSVDVSPIIRHLNRR